MFQDMNQEPEPGSIVTKNPLQDNLTKIEMAKNQAIQQGDWETFEKIKKDITVKDEDLDIKDIADPQYYEMLKKAMSGEEEINEMIEDVWVDFNKQLKVQESKLESMIQDEVNERLRQFLK